MFFRIASVSLALLSLIGCQSINKVTEQPVESSIGVVSEYRVGMWDQLQVNVWRNPDLSVSTTVRPDGKISVPLLGELDASGKTTVSLADEIAVGLEKYIRSPNVTVIVNSPVSTEYIHRVRLTGAVQNQRSMPYREGMTVMDLVLDSGGLNEFANGNKAKLYRQTDEGVKTYPVFIDDILEKGILDSNYALFPQDIITVPELGF